jgi:ATP-dependent DNA helicase RecG
VSGRAEQTRLLDAPVSRIRSVGGKRLRGLEKLGVGTVRDLLTCYPYRYNDFSQLSSIATTPLGELSSVLGTVADVKVKRPRPRLLVTEVSLVDDTGVLIASWFNQPWLQKNLAAGTRVILRGKVEHSFGFRRMNSPLHTVLDASDVAGGIMPVYRANSDITTGWVARLVDEALATLPAPLDPLPATLRTRLGLMSRHSALRTLHHPSNEPSRREARRRLAFEEVFFLQIFLLQRRRRMSADTTPRAHRINGVALEALKAALPFDLTHDQRRAAEEILAGMARPEVMNRLLLGDVGSGKTVVAAFALAAARDSGFQAAMMAPTEVLAEQYAHKLGPLFDTAQLRWALLTSATKPSVRTQLLSDLASGMVDVVFGTHALIEPDVVFKQLSLVVIDEQHRFGVEQRDALRAKGQGCDLLAMTATPIPRSLALTIYGDMETSFIRTKPRASVKTTTTVIGRRDIRRAFGGIREALERGEQAYIVCPLISAPQAGGAPDARTGAEGDGSRGEAASDGARRERMNHPPAPAPAHAPTASDGVHFGAGRAPGAPEEGDEGVDEPLITEFSTEQDEGHIQAAEQEVRFLKAKVFPERRIGLMTSRLKSAEKRQVMDDFRNGRLDILVSTTVIEVGVDVPNATVMVIEDADRFGLSQLHQLRGRVGRGSRDGAVFLVSGSHNEDARARLALMERSSDGFELAEHDLKLRREGDVLGSRQHGQAALKLVNVIHDAELIGQAHDEATQLLACDPLLDAPEHHMLAYELAILYPRNAG